MLRSAAVSILLIGIVGAANASHQVCHCKLNRYQGGVYQQLNDYTTPVGKKFHKMILVGGDYGDCKAACTNWVGSNFSMVQANACSTSPAVDDVFIVRADINDSPAMQSRRYKVVKKYDMKCPSGWLSNTTNVPGGITTDGRCKLEHIIQSITPSLNPPPPNGTPIGNWGFYWNNALVEYGTPTSTGPGVCGLEQF